MPTAANAASYRLPDHKGIHLDASVLTEFPRQFANQNMITHTPKSASNRLMRAKFNKNNGSIPGSENGERGSDKKFWMSDKNCDGCYECGASFNIFTRRHHCRICGRIFCDRCSSNTVDGAKFGYQVAMFVGDIDRYPFSAVRVCTFCHQLSRNHGPNDHLSSDASSRGRTRRKGEAADAEGEVSRPGGNAALKRTPRIESVDDTTMESTHSVRTNDLSVYEHPSTSNGLESLPTLESQFRKFHDLTPRRPLPSQSHPRAALAHSHSRSSSTAPGAHSPRSATGVGALASMSPPRLTQSVSLPPQAARSFVQQRVSRTPQPRGGGSGDVSVIGGLHSAQDLRSASPPGIKNTFNGSFDALTSSMPKARDQDLTLEGAATDGALVISNSVANGGDPSSSRRSTSLLSAALKSTDSDALASDGGGGGEVAVPTRESRFKDLPNGREDTRSILKYLHNLVKVHDRHLQKVIETMLEVEKLEVVWADTIARYAREAVQRVKPDVKRGDQMDIRHYVKVKKIAGGKRSDCRFVDGVVFRKNIAHRKMRSRIETPKILLLSCALEYERVHNRLAVLEVLIKEEREYVEILVGKILALNPDIVIVQRTVSGLAQKLLLNAGVTLIVNVDARMMERISRSTGASILSSPDHADPQARERVLGTCMLFRTELFPDDLQGDKGRQQTPIMFFEGCNTNRHCSIYLRGASRRDLARVKVVMNWAVHTAYHLSCEQSLMNDLRAHYPKPEDADYSDIESTKTASPFLTFPQRRDRSSRRRERDGRGGASSKKDDFEGASANHWIHQKFLFGSCWLTDLHWQCFPPEIKGIEFYSAYKDKTFGHFLIENCFDAKSRCLNKKCKKTILEHVLSYSHFRGRLTVVVTELAVDLPLASSADQIFMWSRCRKCPDCVTPMLPMSEDTWKISFGKFLELIFYNRGAKSRAGACKHSIFRDHVCFFARGNLVVSFEYEEVRPYKVVRVLDLRHTLNFKSNREAIERSIVSSVSLHTFAEFLWKIGELIELRRLQPHRDELFSLKATIQAEQTRFSSMLDETHPAGTIMWLNMLRRRLYIHFHQWNRLLYGVYYTSSSIQNSMVATPVADEGPSDHDTSSSKSPSLAAAAAAGDTGRSRTMSLQPTSSSTASGRSGNKGGVGMPPREMSMSLAVGNAIPHKRPTPAKPKLRKSRSAVDGVAAARDLEGAAAETEDTGRASSRSLDSARGGGAYGEPAVAVDPRKRSISAASSNGSLSSSQRTDRTSRASNASTSTSTDTSRLRVPRADSTHAADEHGRRKSSSRVSVDSSRSLSLSPLNSPDIGPSASSDANASASERFSSIDTSMTVDTRVSSASTGAGVGGGVRTRKSRLENLRAALRPSSSSKADISATSTDPLTGLTSADLTSLSRTASSGGAGGYTEHPSGRSSRAQSSADQLLPGGGGVGYEQPNDATSWRPMVNVETIKASRLRMREHKRAGNESARRRASKPNAADASAQSNSTAQSSAAAESANGNESARRRASKPNAADASAQSSSAAQSSAAAEGANGSSSSSNDSQPTTRSGEADFLDSMSGHGHLSLPLCADDLVVPVYSDEPSSIIAYTLCSDAHRAKLGPLYDYVRTVKAEKAAKASSSSSSDSKGESSASRHRSSRSRSRPRKRGTSLDPVLLEHHMCTHLAPPDEILEYTFEDSGRLQTKPLDEDDEDDVESRPVGEPAADVSSPTSPTPSSRSKRNSIEKFSLDDRRVSSSSTNSGSESPSSGSESPVSPLAMFKKKPSQSSSSSDRVSSSAPPPLHLPTSIPETRRSAYSQESLNASPSTTDHGTSDAPEAEPIMRKEKRSSRSNSRRQSTVHHSKSGDTDTQLRQDSLSKDAAAKDRRTTVTDADVGASPRPKRPARNRSPKQSIAEPYSSTEAASSARRNLPSEKTRRDKTVFRCAVLFPRQFYALRQFYCGGEEVYIESLSRSLKWIATGGKSGSTFLKTLDDRFVLKCIPSKSKEFAMFVERAHAYFEYMANAFFSKRPTVLVPMLGIYQVSWGTKRVKEMRTMHIFVMPNLFYAQKINKVFDLKGSVRNRYIKGAQDADDDVVLLDENFNEFTRGFPIPLDDTSKELLRISVHNDTLFLCNLDIVDYSLLVGLDMTKETPRLVCGIIDYSRQYTWDKIVETVAKSVTSNKVPTVVSPKNYRERFRLAMERYFMVSADRYTQMASTHEERR